ncbi:hypothetical protein [Variovorax gossypii]
MNTRISGLQMLPPHPRSFFLAGVMQGARGGRDLADQSYRPAIARAIRRHFPNAVVHDPAERMWDNLQTSRERIREAHTALLQTPKVARSDLDPALLELTQIFHRQTAMAGNCDVCVVFLPNNEPSMGTAAEMLTAHNAGRFVVAITRMRQNLAVLACSQLIVESMETFENWLSTLAVSPTTKEGAT